MTKKISNLRAEQKLVCRGKVSGSETRVLVLGSGGAGKSTFSKKLANTLDLPLFHLDKLYWNPGWIETSKEDFREKVGEIVAKDKWIVDGNYSTTYDQRLTRANLVIILDLPRITCLRRAVWRAVKNKGKSRPDMAEGCAETIDFEFYSWIWNYPIRTIPKTIDAIKKYGIQERSIVLQSKQEMKQLLEACKRI